MAILVNAIFRRMLLLLSINKYSFVFIHREAMPIGPPVFEWFTAVAFRKKIIYDFDDAIWLTDNHSEGNLIRFFKWRSKVAATCRWSYKISCGNAFLAEYARNFNTNVIVNPTTIDTENVHNPALFPIPERKAVTIGWTGSHSTLKYLLSLRNVLQRIEQEFQHVNILIIADREPPLELTRLTFRKWSTKTEIADLMEIDIGIMPLPDDEWSKGKCGFKALQYMALEKPAVVSPVGVNSEIINDSTDGYLANSEEEWHDKLTQLIMEPQLRQKIGKCARHKVLSCYSVFSNRATFLSLFQ